MSATGPSYIDVQLWQANLLRKMLHLIAVIAGELAVWISAVEMPILLQKGRLVVRKSSWSIFAKSCLCGNSPRFCGNTRQDQFPKYCS
jgi:hypothetical protein